MYTSYIGKKFLKIYNENQGLNLSAEEFFDKEFFPLFFEDNSHLMHVGNSPFFQKPKEGDVKKYGSKSLAQYNNLKQAIKKDEPNMSIFVGSSAKDVAGTTSGQVSNIKVDIDENEMYASWIGEALAIGVSGGFVMLIDEIEILWELYLGWKYYREYLEQTPNLKDKQIETWNGQWFCHITEKMYNSKKPFDYFNVEPAVVQGNLAIPTKEWVQVLFGLTKKFPDKIITAYAYNLSQTNTTLGFINLYLKDIYTLFDLKDRIIINEKDTVLTEKEIKDYATFFNFKRACEFGVIGLKAIEPAKLREYMPKGSVMYAEGKDYKFGTEESYINYKHFKIWIIAMLNKTELLQLASDIAGALLELERQEQRGKKTLFTLSQEIRESKNLRIFIDKLGEVLILLPEKSEALKNTVEEVLKMPSDNFPLFVTLIRFEYNYLKLKN